MGKLNIGVNIGGRRVVAFVEVSEYGSNRINSVYPIAAESGWGIGFNESSEACVDVWGVDSDRGKRIAAAYRAGELPTRDTDELNKILRPDECAQA